MTDVACNVVGCGYVADGVLAEYGDFPVCALHDHDATRKILTKFQRPHHYRSACGRPMVMPCGDLTEADFVRREPVKWPEGYLHAADDPRLANVPTGPSTLHPDFDLTAGR